MKNTLIVAGVLILLSLGTGAYFFKDSFMPEKEPAVLRIVMNTATTDMSPYGLNLSNLTRISNIYESLVTFDKNLKVVPGLAISWGNIDAKNWEFRLRQDVFFHDGTPFTAQDVIDTYEKAMNSGDSQIESYISTIQTMRASNDNRIIITTLSPDPLLLSKLTKLFIYKDGNMGTGPYILDEVTPDQTIRLKAFSDYWSNPAVFPVVEYKVIANRLQREQAFRNGEIDLLVGLTEELALTLPARQVIRNYGLEVNFLMFKLDDSLFSDISVRQAVRSLIDPDRIEAIGNRFVRSTNQFIAEGVFGYNQKIPAYAYDSADEARDLFGKRLERVDLDYLGTYGTLADYLSNQLKMAGFSVQKNVVEPAVLLDKISQNESQLFVVGWFAEDGDAGGFFDAFAHSAGAYNNGRYKNPEVDALIEESRAEMDPKKRLALLQQISARVMEDLIGIPLYETSRLYGIREGISWEPRLDGQILGIEFRQIKGQ